MLCKIYKNYLYLALIYIFLDKQNKLGVSQIQVNFFVRENYNHSYYYKKINIVFFGLF